MAEVIAWDNHRHWLPVYTYPNAKMYQADEKLALNRFLGDWLTYFRKTCLTIEETNFSSDENTALQEKLNKSKNER